MALGSTNALIAGGGIGGLAAAIALARKGIDVQVCERRPEYPEEGAGIQLGPNGSRILAELGVAEFLADKIATPDALIVHDAASGRDLTRLPLGSWIAERHGAPYWTAHRRDLHVALRMRAEAEPRITLTRAAHILSCTSGPDGVAGVSVDGEVFRASLLVAADGLWSGLRPAISRTIPRLNPIGKAAMRTVTSAENLPGELAGNAVHIWLSAGAHVVHYPVDGGREIALVVIADDGASGEDWDAPAEACDANEKVKSFAAPLRKLVESANRWRQWSLYRASPLPSWTNGRTALLGDAAHPMLPFLAQGAVMALEDAAVLATSVAAANGNPERALHDYETIRRPRVAKVVDASFRNGRIYHMHGAAALARNAAMKLRSPEHVMAGFDWLYGWRQAGC